jgi:hypothetical protein
VNGVTFTRGYGDVHAPARAGRFGGTVRWEGQVLEGRDCWAGGYFSASACWILVRVICMRRFGGLVFNFVIPNLGQGYVGIELLPFVSLKRETCYIDRILVN